MDKALYDAGRRNAGRRQCCAQAQARLTQLDSLDSDFPYPEFDSNEIVEANTSREDVSMGDGKNLLPALLTEEGLDLFDFDQRQVLTRLIVTTKVPIAFDSGTGNDADELSLDLRLA